MLNFENRSKSYLWVGGSCDLQAKGTTVDRASSCSPPLETTTSAVSGKHDDDSDVNADMLRWAAQVQLGNITVEAMPAPSIERFWTPEYISLQL